VKLNGQMIGASRFDGCILLNAILFALDHHPTVVVGRFLDGHHFFELKCLHQGNHRGF
jgi:hypothetical protein